MKITKSLVAKVKKSNAELWHTAAWHCFQSLPEVEAVNFALGLGEGDVIEEANKYLQAQQTK